MSPVFQSAPLLSRIPRKNLLLDVIIVKIAVFPKYFHRRLTLICSPFWRSNRFNVKIAAFQSTFTPSILKSLKKNVDLFSFLKKQFLFQCKSSLFTSTSCCFQLKRKTCANFLKPLYFLFGLRNIRIRVFIFFNDYYSFFPESSFVLLLSLAELYVT